MTLVWLCIEGHILVSLLNLVVGFDYGEKGGGGGVSREAENKTYLETCLLRSAESFAVQGLMMVSDGEMYCLELRRQDGVSKS